MKPSRPASCTVDTTRGAEPNAGQAHVVQRPPNQLDRPVAVLSGVRRLAAEVVSHAHRPGRVAGHGVDPAVRGAGPDREHRQSLVRQPVEPLAGGHRLPGHRVVAEAAPVALVLECLVGDRPLDDEDERLQLAPVGLEELLQEVRPRRRSGRTRSRSAASARRCSAAPAGAPSAISSMLGWVAAVSATESPSQLSPALIHSTWMRGWASAVSGASTLMATPRPARRPRTPRADARLRPPCGLHRPRDRR
jgi:hypothetical protein